MKVPYQVTDNAPAMTLGIPLTWGVQVWFNMAIRVGWACDRLHANRMIRFMKGGDQ